MATNYPGGKDTWDDPAMSTLMNAPGFDHTAAHGNVQDAVEAIETFVGTSGSPGPALTPYATTEQLAAFASVPNVIADRLVYVSSAASASDSNNGLSWGAAKATIAGALAAYSGHALHVLVGQGTFIASGLTPVAGSVIEGMGHYLTTIELAANGTLVSLSGTSDTSVIGATLAATSAVTAGTLLDISNSFSCHFEDVRLSGTSTGAAGSFTGQIGVQFDNNAGDNTFHDFLISNLGVGCQVNSQTNYFSQGQFTNCVNHIQGGDATGAAFVSGVCLEEVTFNGAGTNYVNVTGTAGAWHLSKVWFDGGATNAVVVGTGTFGPTLFSIRDCPQLAAQTSCLTINAAGMIVMDGVRWGDPGTHPTELTINSTNALYGYAAGLRSAQAFEFPSIDFPPLWTVLGRDYVNLPSTVNSAMSVQSSVTGSPALTVNGPAGITTDLLVVQKGGATQVHVDQFGIGHAGAWSALNYAEIGNGSVTGARLWSGSGAPTINTNKGDIYFRTDTPTTANQRIYINTSAGSGTTWTGIL